MTDKTPLYMLLIVGVVAVVGIILIAVNHAGTPASTISNTGSESDVRENPSELASQVQDNGMTGNVVAFQSDVPRLNIFGKFFFIIFMVGIAAYMYFRLD